MASNEAALSFQVRTDLEAIDKDLIHVNLIPNMLRTGKKVYDAYFLYKAIFYALEFKLEKGGTFNFKHHMDTRPHQSDCLRKVKACGGLGYFFIGFNKYDTAFLMTPDDVVDMRNIFGDSIKYSDFIANINEDMTIERCKIDGKKQWNVRKILCH